MKMIWLLVLIVCGCVSFKDPPPIKIQPGFISNENRTVVTIFGVVWVPKRNFDYYTKENPSITARAILEHEYTHARRQHKLGMFRWHYKYVFDRRFRAQEELIAFGEELKFLIKEGATIFRANFILHIINGDYGVFTPEQISDWFDHFIRSYPEAKVN